MLSPSGMDRIRTNEILQSNLIVYMGMSGRAKYARGSRTALTMKVNIFVLTKKRVRKCPQSLSRSNYKTMEISSRLMMESEKY